MEHRVERFGGLFAEGYGPVVAYARRRVAAAEVDDVVAETFLVAWRRLDDLPAASELSWLYGVARRVVANQRRSADRRLRLVARLGLQREAPVAGVAEGPGSDVLDALGRLRPQDQEILRLAAWEGLGPSDIAVVLGCTPNAAALRLSRARRQLRDSLTGSTGIRTATPRRDSDD